MDESEVQPERMFFLKSGETVNTEGLARKLKGAIFELTQEPPATDEDSAMAALAGFDIMEDITGTMDRDELEIFIDEFCEAWAKD